MQQTLGCPFRNSHGPWLFHSGNEDVLHDNIWLVVLGHQDWYGFIVFEGCGRLRVVLVSTVVASCCTICSQLHVCSNVFGGWSKHYQIPPEVHLHGLTTWRMKRWKLYSISEWERCLYRLPKLWSSISLICITNVIKQVVIHSSLTILYKFKRSLLKQSLSLWRVQFLGGPLWTCNMQAAKLQFDKLVNRKLPRMGRVNVKLSISFMGLIKQKT